MLYRPFHRLAQVIAYETGLSQSPFRVHCMENSCILFTYNLLQGLQPGDNTLLYVGSEVLTAVVMKSTIFWDITPCYIPEDSTLNNLLVQFCRWLLHKTVDEPDILCRVFRTHEAVFTGSRVKNLKKLHESALEQLCATRRFRRRYGVNVLAVIVIYVIGS
jgi:hypothetical protein